MGWRIDRKAVAGIHMQVPEIVGKGRPRFTRYGRAYTPKKTRAFEQSVRAEWLRQYGDRFASWEGPVSLSVRASRELAASNPRYWEGRADTGKPDADNVLKSVMDALNGAAYRDDAEIVSARVVKAKRAAHGDGSTLGIRVSYYVETRFKEE